MKKIFTLLLGTMAAMTAVAADEVIMTPPEGATKTLYCRNSVGIRLGMFGSLENFEYYGMATDLYQVGKEVYMQNPVCPFLYDGYIKGTMTNTGIEFPLPQPIYVYNENGKTETFYVDMFYYNLNTGQYERDTEPGRSYDLELQPNGQYKFDYWAVHSTTDLWGTVFYTDRLLGVVEGSTGEWMSFGELTCRLLPFDSKTPEPPADLASKEYQFIHDNNGHNIRIGTTDSEIYIQGLLESEPDIWTKGTFDGTKATFEIGDYVGITDGQTIFLTGAEYVTGENPNVPTVKTKKLELKYDKEKDTYTTTDLIMLCNSPELDESFALYENSEIRPEPSVLVPEPSTPIITDWTNWDKAMEWSYAHVQLSSLNINGDVLPPDRLSYAFFVDGELYYLDPADYIRLEEEMSWIPYNYTDYFDILAYPGGKRTFYFYAEVDKTFAVQMRYLDDAGNFHYSPKYIVTTPGNEHLSVGVINTEDIESVENYDVTGRKVNKDHQGITIRRMKMSDGTYKTIKVNNLR